MYLALPLIPPVCNMLPAGNTTCRLSMLSFIVPYFTAFVPEALVAAIPHREASAPGSSIAIDI